MAGTAKHALVSESVVLGEVSFEHVASLQYQPPATEHTTCASLIDVVFVYVATWDSTLAVNA